VSKLVDFSAKFWIVGRCCSKFRVFSIKICGPYVKFYKVQVCGRCGLIIIKLLEWWLDQERCCQIV
jgi:hypothetical protein